jgi:hypothetical protein
MIMEAYVSIMHFSKPAIVIKKKMTTLGNTTPPTCRSTQFLVAADFKRKDFIKSVIQTNQDLESMIRTNRSVFRHILSTKDPDIILSTLLHRPDIAISPDIIYPFVGLDSAITTDIMPLIVAKIRDDDPTFEIESFTSIIQLTIDNLHIQTCPYSSRNIRKFNSSRFAAHRNQKISNLTHLSELVQEITTITPIWTLKVIILREINKKQTDDANVILAKKTWPLLFQVRSGNTWKR